MANDKEGEEKKIEKFKSRALAPSFGTDRTRVALSEEAIEVDKLVSGPDALELAARLHYRKAINLTAATITVLKRKAEYTE
ncbi:hypothetical protein Sjap_017149 [Stephania japonica]|uniref:Uncharacterized protein n=1 Tax=Stephania japonica TaxID=461633 RepID=A0AAP0NJJ5_9MAGN